MLFWIFLIRKGLLLHYKNQCEKKDKEYMKKSQELDNKIYELDNLRLKYSPEKNPKVRYYSPSPSRVVKK